jgi:uroporphyrinogen-III decarboxylase
MEKLNSQERLLKVLKGEEVDRIPTFDLLHSIDLFEHVTQQKLTVKNAEDLVCKTGHQLLDLIRHFAIPDRLEPWSVKDETGFVYHFEWWTGHVAERPLDIRSSREVESAMKRDIDIIYNCIEKKKVCHLARQHVQLFDERFEYIEEVKADFARLNEKLQGTVMMAPEDVSSTSVVAERYDETGWWYVYNDYPETARRYLDALTDYQVCFIDNFADAKVSPITQISLTVGTTTALIYSPQFFRTEVIPREKRKIDRWKKHGYIVFAFLDGYSWPLLGDFLEAGVDEIHPCQPLCGMDVKSIRQKYPELVISQPIDGAQLLPFGKEDQVREAVIKAIEDGGRRKIIIGSTSDIHPETPVKNALAMFETARNYPL